MIRTQIQLTEQQAASLKSLAAQQGVSMATLIRKGVDRILEENDRRARRERALEVIGRFPGPADLAERHDDYFGEEHA
jgi:hypothetical protein